MLNYRIVDELQMSYLLFGDWRRVQNPTTPASLTSHPLLVVRWLTGTSNVTPHRSTLPFGWPLVTPVATTIVMAYNRRASILDNRTT